MFPKIEEKLNEETNSQTIHQTSGTLNKTGSSEKWLEHYFAAVRDQQSKRI